MILNLYEMIVTCDTPPSWKTCWF